MKNMSFLLFAIVLFVSSCASEQGEFEKATQVNTMATYKEFMEKYPDSKFIENAKDSIRSLEFSSATKENTIEAYTQFLEKYPDGKFIESAKDSIRSREVEVLIDQLKDSDLEVILSAVEKLKNRKDKKALEPLIDLLEKHKDPSKSRKEETLQTITIQALVNIEDKRALIPLQNGLKRENDLITRLFYAWAIAKFRDPEGVRLLLEALSDTGQPNRVNVAKVLRKFAGRALLELSDEGKLEVETLLAFIKNEQHEIISKKEELKKWIYSLSRRDLDAISSGYGAKRVEYDRRWDVINVHNDAMEIGKEALKKITEFND